MIETARLLLRAWRDDDREPFLAMCSSAAVMEHLGGPATTETVDAAIARTHASQAEHGHCFWALERKGDGAFLGFCGLKVLSGLDPLIEGDIEIGWRLREDVWGHGYACEAAEASLAWGWANLAAVRIIAITVPANVRSWGLMRRLGMRRCRELDFCHPAFASGHPLRAHITHAAERRVDGSVEPA